jgi:MFS family permease
VGAGRNAAAGAGSAASALAGLKEAAGYIWHKPDQLGAFSIAFLVNLLAFPFGLGLLPYAARDVFDVGQIGLGYLAAAFASGALAGSLFVGAGRLRLRAGRVMLLSATVWFSAIVLFGQTRALGAAFALLFIAGFAQSFCMTPLAAVMLRGAAPEMRGRVMGMRMLAIWGLPLGLLAAGPFIARFGFAACTALFAGLGLAATAAIAWRWREALWRRSSPANAHL